MAGNQAGHVAAQLLGCCNCTEGYRCEGGVVVLSHHQRGLEATAGSLKKFNLVKQCSKKGKKGKQKQNGNKTLKMGKKDEDEDTKRKS